nr:immunoglobulin heavy chain junction region [Mus musculus]
CARWGNYWYFDVW